MSVASLIAELDDAGIEIWEEAGQLRFRAPRGVMSDERKGALKEHRDEILAHLRERTVTLTAGRDLWVDVTPRRYSARTRARDTRPR